MPVLRNGAWETGIAPARSPVRSAIARVARAVLAPWRVARRAMTHVPWTSGGQSPFASAQHRAMSLVPVWASVRFLASNIASLPLQLYRRNGGTRQRIDFVPQLLFAPAALDDLYQWLQKLVVSLALRGNAYGLIVQRDDLGYPTMIEWLDPDDVFVDDLHPTLPVYYWCGQIVPREDIFHVPWIVPPGRAVGLSPMQVFARTVGVGLAVQQYGARWFENGGTPPAVMRNTQKTLTRGEADEIRDRLMSSISSGKPLVFGADWDFTALSISPEESQFIETARLNATQIAAIYGVPPTQVGGDSGGSMTYANVEQEAINVVNFTLRPWLALIESRLSRLMPGSEFVKFNADAMIRGDTLSRYQAYNLALTGQWMVPNEVRATEDRPPVPWGDDPNPIPGASPEPSGDSAGTETEEDAPDD